MLEDVKQKIQDLIKKYEVVKASGGLVKYTEEETKKDFILPLFAALGWNVDDKKEVTAEEQISGDRVDYGFYLNGRIKFYLEAKKLAVDLHREDFAQQAIRYSWNKGVTWAILTDFESLIVFNALSPEKSLAGKKYLSFTYQEYLTRFDELWRLSKEAFGDDVLDKEAERVGKKLQKISVTETLSKDLHDCREILTEAFSQWNDNIDPHLIDEGVQKLLNRLVFIRCAEDRKIEPPTLIPLIHEYRSSGQAGKISPFQAMVKKFRELDAIYDSNLFDEHPFEKWDEFGGATEKVIDILHGKKNYFEYDFSIIPADVLGAVYESYLGYKMEQSKKKVSAPGADSAKDHRKRKEQGIYYTPKYIVDYIVQNALGPVLNKCKSINDLQKIKVLDPACGSGSFLVAAMNFLIKKYEDFGVTPDGLLKIQILEDNIYGVDLDKQAVELARLNLLLNTFDHQFKLPNLGGNIKNGNSLISGNDEELEKYFGKNYRDKKPFNWREEFPKVFKQGGFDCIIGNPPWVTVTHKEIGQEMVEFLKEKYVGAEGFKLNLFPLFVELGINLLKKDGIVSLIRLLDTPSYKGVREKFVNKYDILDIQNIPSGAFDGVVAGNIILSIQKTPNKKNYIEIFDFITKNKTEISINDVEKNENLTININSNTESSEAIKKVKNGDTIPLKEVCDIHVGMMIKNKKEKFFREPIFNYSIVEGKDLARFFVKNRNYFDIDKIEIFGGTKNIKKHQEHPKLFIRKTGNTIICALDLEGIFAEQSVYLVLLRNKDFDIKFLCAYLNSKLITSYFQNELITNPGAYPYIQHYDLETVPVIKADVKIQKIFAQYTDKIIELNQNLLQSIENSDQWHKIKDEIAKTDQKIDQEVYKLYGLTDEEIKIVEKD